MRRAVVTLALVLVAGLLPAEAARAGAPELMERAVLPTTGALPTCACAVPLREAEQLIVGLASGELVSFHETAGMVIPRIVELPGSGPVEDVVACRVNSSAGTANAFALLAVQGSRLYAVSFGDMTVQGDVALALPTGSYRLATVRRDPHDGLTAPGSISCDPVVYDDDTVMRIVVDSRSFGLRVETVLEHPDGVSVTSLSDRVSVVGGGRVIECAGGAVMTSIHETDPPREESTRILIAGRPEGGRTLELRVSDQDSVWISRTVDAPGEISVASSVGDTLVAMGGTVPLTRGYDIGWVALVGPSGRIVAATDHARTVTNITRVSDFIAVQGDGRNLSLYDLGLKPLWDHDSPVTDVVLLSGHFAGGEAEDLAVVGTRTYEVSAGDVDSIRMFLDQPEFMAGAERDGSAMVLKRSFITFCVSNEDVLRQSLTEETRAAGDAFDEGDVGAAIKHATSARAAAAVLGDRDGLRSLTSRLREYVSFEGRRRSLLISALVLLILGAWVAVAAVRRSERPPVLIVGTVLLLAAGAWAWKLIGDAGLNPALFAGGVVAGASIARTRVTTKPVRRVSGAAIEDLIRVLMEFLHGAGEGVPSDGVADTARKTVTKVAYLAQEMVDSMDDEERYAMLKDRFRARGSSFLDATYPRVAVLLSLARRACFIEHEAEQMSAAAEKMRLAIATILSETAPDAPMLKHQLQMIKEGRDQLATAADRAWAIVQTNPGCSLTRSVDRILDEKSEELDEEGARAEAVHGVPKERDAIALWSFEFRFILENLVTNAIRAMRSTPKREFRIETSSDGETCSVRVIDTGEGMDEATAGSLFDAKDDERGGGFGMPNSRRTLREAGGDIVVERTAPGKGTTFLLTIPHWTPTNGDTDA